MSPGVGLAVVLVLVAANGFFVAAEFALVASRRETIDARAQAGSRRARAASAALENLSFVLSGAQFGITATSLLVGFLAEDSIGALLEPVLEATGLPEGTALAASVTGAFVISTIVQMVMGELAPKNLAIARPETVAIAVAPMVQLYGIVFGPLIRLFDGAAERVSGWLGVEPQEELLGGASLGELSRIISASGAEGSLSEDQAGLLARAVELGQRRVSEIMVPRPDIVWLDAGATLGELREHVRRSGHSRFPIRGEHEDDVAGTVHIKDLLRLDPAAREVATVADLVTPALFVPESEPLRRLLNDFRRARRTFAVVVDEYGGTAGIATIEDLVEELVGEIEDEFDRDVSSIRRVGADRYIVNGRFRAQRLEELLDIAVPDGDFETIAGLCLSLLGRIPDEGVDFVHDGWRFTVTEMDLKRIARVRIDREPVPAPEVAP